MKMYRLKCLCAMLIALPFLVSCIDKVAIPGRKPNCPIKPFHKFAYSPDNTSRPIPKILPDTPWIFEADIPGLKEEVDDFSDIQIVLARTTDEQQEIWLYKPPFVSNFEGVNKKESFVIYLPQTKTWEEVPALMENSNLIVEELFTTSDGTLWGQISFDQPYAVPDVGPVLGKYNKSTKRFEPAVGGLNIPIYDKYLLQSYEVVVDRQDEFWIFGPNDAVYHYDPESRTTTKQADLPRKGMDRFSVALALDGNIFLQDKSLRQQDDEFLFQFLPGTREIVTIDVSKEPWEASHGMLVDQKGRLWLGAMGYMETDSTWHILHRNAPKVWENLGEIRYWSPPTLIYESSNGLLWYAEYHDMGRLGEGTAWYDPKTGEGCLFTNIASYIVEDANEQLWMVADGNLYRYPLDE